MGLEKKKNHRIEDIRRSCLNCGWQHYNHDPCCSNPLCVSDIEKENKKLKNLCISYKANCEAQLQEHDFCHGCEEHGDENGHCDCIRDINNCLEK